MQKLFSFLVFILWAHENPTSYKTGITTATAKPAEAGKIKAHTSNSSPANPGESKLLTIDATANTRWQEGTTDANREADFRDWLIVF